ncbi:MAG: SIS domain-containing protein [bacterium]
MSSEPLNTMREEIAAQKDYIAGQVDRLLSEALKSFDLKVLRVIERIYLVGCGDSLAAALALRCAFERNCSLPVQALHAMEFARYDCPRLPPRSLVVAISNSGRVVRTIEAALLARRRGAYVIALTRDADSPLALAAQVCIPTQVPDTVGVSPGTLSYFAILTALSVISVFLGEVMSGLTHLAADETYYRLKKGGEALSASLGLLEPLIKDYAQKLLGSAMIHILGSGPCYGVARYGAMKFLEAVALPSLPSDIEEYAHSGFFLTRPGSHVIVLSPKGNSRSRALELIEGIQAVGGVATVIAPQDDEEARKRCDRFLPLVDNLPEEFCPLVYSLPFQLLSLHLGRLAQATPLGFDDPKRQQANFKQIFEGHCQKDFEGLG